MNDTPSFIKAFLIIGLVFIVLGGIIFAVAMTANGWDFNVLASHVIEERVVEITDEDEIASISSVNVKFSTSDIKIVYHEENKITVEGYDLVKRNGKVTEKLTAKVVNGELIITHEKNKSVLFETGTYGKRRITVKLPKDMVIDLSAQVSTGDIIFGESGKDIAFKDVSAKTSTGDVYIDGNVDCDNISIANSTGDVYIKGNLKTVNFTRNASTGDLFINARVEANSIRVEQSTGDVKCDSYITANSINIKVSTGDVTLRLLGMMADYNYSYDISTGDSNISSVVSPSATKSVYVKTSTGDVNVYFEQ